MDRSVEAVKDALEIGPLVVLVSSKSKAFVYYRGGIIDEAACGDGKIDHAVMLVGYGEQLDDKTGKKHPYFIIKNSWGKHWGEEGYARLSAAPGKNKRGTCGILTFPLIGLVKSGKLEPISFEVIDI